MKIVQINVTCGAGSTGKICVSVSELLTKQKIENYIFYTSGKSDLPRSQCYMSPMEIKWQALKSRVFGNYGFNSSSATKRLLQKIDQIKPDIVHLHNLHGHNCNLELLFSYLKKNNIKIFWTFHDCWAFTGYCPHFDMIQCDHWKSGCGHCPERKKYSWFFDRSHTLLQKKKEAFSGLDLTIITPSDWLANLVRQSFLKNYPIKTIHNGIDLNLFKPTSNDFRSRYGLQNSFIVLGVAFDWGIRKGLDVFIELANRLDDRYKIVLVGTNEEVDRQLPKNILSIHRTHNQQELTAIYTEANVLVNPTREDTFPTVHLEALACGTPIIAFNTGGCKEMLDNTCGLVTPQNDLSTLQNAIQLVCENEPFSKDACRQRAQQFDQNQKFQEYLNLYF